MKPVLTNLEETPGPQPVEAHAEMPIWTRRLFLIIYVLFCMDVGIFLVTLPWTPRWENLLEHWPSLRHLLGHGFVRGAISGLGFVDLWLAIAEAVNYREHR